MPRDSKTLKREMIDCVWSYYRLTTASTIVYPSSILAAAAAAAASFSNVKVDV